MTQDDIDKVRDALRALGWHVQSTNIHLDGVYQMYKLQVEAIAHRGTFPKTKSSGVRLPDIDPDPTPKALVCECGAAAAKTTHSSWCPLTAATKP